MIRLVLFVAVLAGLTAGAVWLANDPGAVSVIWRGWRMDTSVGILLLIVALTVLAVLAVAKIIALLRGTALGFAAARKERRTARGLTALGHGFAAVHAGQAQAARKFAKEAAALLDDNPATQMLATHAAAATGDGAALRSIAAGLLDKPETELAALRELAARAQTEGDVVGALNYAKRALARKDAPKWAMDMVLDVQIANGRWADALGALDSKLSRDHYAPEIHKRLRAEFSTRAAEDAISHGDANAAEAAARKALDAGGGERAIAAHARALAMQGKQKKAAAEIERAWTAHPGQALLRAYRAAMPGETTLDWARRVERLVKDSADHPESRLALAEASLKAQLWGQARNRLAPLLGEDVSADVHARAALLMAELETGERQDAEAGSTWIKRAFEKSQLPGRGGHAPRSVAEVLAG
ncbi:MAG: heme biosynthesis HemY N-terminal domain-containing protein [Rhodospirillaceae bacterium]|nr:heme biosynthesis HemY N-terminal domain-containing protein [Rhodospirillaceae bacterium]